MRDSIKEGAQIRRVAETNYPWGIDDTVPLLVQVMRFDYPKALYLVGRHIMQVIL